jgi:uncharacterized protein (DUF1684 family)
MILAPSRLRGLLLCLAFAVPIACSNKPPEEPKDYVSKIASDRAAKDAQFAKDDEPVPANRKGEFLPLDYFPIDPDYHVPAALKRSDDPTIIDMPTSTGTTRKMRRVGTLEFTLKGQQLKLTAFVEVGSDPNRLFVPFSDLTSGTETYPAGRFMDLDRTATGIYEVDFNRAYNPYCYYSPTWECPYPPPENRLKVPIRAGERMKGGKAA